MFSWSTVVHNNKYWLAKFEEKNELKGIFKNTSFQMIHTGLCGSKGSKK